MLGAHLTAEEAWNYLPVKDAVSVQLTDWPQVNPAYKDEELDRRWQALLSYRDVVMRRLEEARKEKRIGSSLTAALELYPDEKAYAALLPFKERLAEIFIVSACTLHEAGAQAAGTVVEQGLGVAVKTAEGEKCDRCWMIHPQLGTDPAHPTLCPRCSENVKAL